MAKAYFSPVSIKLPKALWIPLSFGLFKTLLTGSGNDPPFSILFFKFSILKFILLFSLTKFVNFNSKLFLFSFVSLNFVSWSFVFFFYLSISFVI